MRSMIHSAGSRQSTVGSTDRGGCRRAGLSLAAVLIACCLLPAAYGQPDGYTLVPGDVIEVIVSSHTGYDRTLTIQPDGRIYFSVAGEIVAAGLTVPRLAARLQEGLSAELVDPRVTVALKEINRSLLRRVSVLGAVKNPGSYELKQQSTVAELLATAGGPTSVADLRRITVTRADGGKSVRADLSRALRTGEVSDPRPAGDREAVANVALEPGDLIIVPEGAPPTALVLGEVARPGSYELQGEMRLLDALSLAGGPTPKADLRRITLTRTGQTDPETVDLQELLTRGQPAKDSSRLAARGSGEQTVSYPEPRAAIRELPAASDEGASIVLRPGDILVVPENERKCYVLGEVNRPEAFPLKPNDRLLDAITTTGGATREADLTRVMLIRKDPKGQPVVRRVDLKQMMKTGDLARNELLREGDVIFIPNRKPKPPIPEYLGLLYPLGGLLSLFRF
jgi:polysaccharide biosynthesis/export protein